MNQAGKPDSTNDKPNAMRPVQIASLDKSHSSISLANLFNIVTACALFIACFRVYPLLAVGLTAFFTPVLIRTHLVAEKHRELLIPFPMSTRVDCFLSSMVVVTTILLMGVLAFASVSMIFGLMAYVLGAAMGMKTVLADSAILGTAGGMIWGVAAAFIAMGFAIAKLWLPSLEDEDGAQTKKG